MKAGRDHVAVICYGHPTTNGWLPQPVSAPNAEGHWADPEGGGLFRRALDIRMKACV